MKKLIFLLLTGLLLNTQLNAQYKASVGFAFAPVDLGIGLRVDQTFGLAGIYLAGTGGNYFMLDGYIKDHYKVAAGLILCNPHNDQNTFLTIGGSWHQYGDRLMSSDYNTKKIFSRYSFEVGGGTNINHIRVAFTVDVYKWESLLSIQYTF